MFSLVKCDVNISFPSVFPVEGVKSASKGELRGARKFGRQDLAPLNFLRFQYPYKKEVKEDMLHKMID